MCDGRRIIPRGLERFQLRSGSTATTWDLIEHVRTTGQINSGDIREYDPFARPGFGTGITWGNKSATAEDLARQRERDVERAQRLKQELAELRAYVARRKQTAEEVAHNRLLAEERRAIRAQRKRDRLEREFARKRMQLEYEQLRQERIAEQARRDAEWVAAAPVPVDFKSLEDLALYLAKFPASQASMAALHLVRGLSTRLTWLELRSSTMLMCATG